MMTRNEMFRKLYEFIQFANSLERINHYSITEFLGGMRPTQQGQSMDITVWMDWEKTTSDKIPEEEAYNHFLAFVKHWSKKYTMHSLEEILYQMHPNDIDYKPSLNLKWKELFPTAEIREY